MACFNAWDIGGCGCGTTYTRTYTVQGCNSLPVQGMTVSAYSASGGTLLASGTTNASGQVSLTWTGPLYPWITVTGSPRFASYGALGNVTTIGLTVATGYHCWSGASCAMPLADTLHATDSFLGGATLVYQTAGAFAGRWYATTNYSYPGYTDSGGNWCNPATVNLVWLLSASGLITWGQACTGGNPCCPVAGNAACAFVPSPTTIADTIACPPAFGLTETLTYNGSTVFADNYAGLYGLMTGVSGSLKWTIAPGTTFATRNVTE